MPKYAVVRENKIATVIVATSKESAEQLTNCECIEVTDYNNIGPDYTFDGTKWNKPVINNPSTEEN